MRTRAISAVVIAVAFGAFVAGPALAGGTFGDWNAPPHAAGPGPYTGGGDPHTGDPLCVTVGLAGQEAPAPPFGGNANIMCIDARNKPSKIIVLWTFSCDGSPSDVCKVKYDYGAWSTGSGFKVHVNSGGMYDNPDDVWAPVGIGPHTVSGENSETEPDCSAFHTIEFEVLPGTLLYIDNVTVECLVGNPVPIEIRTWGAIKALYGI